jgi:hypothetical protein
MDYATRHNAIVMPLLLIATVKIGVGVLIYLDRRQRYRAGVAQR